MAPWLIAVLLVPEVAHADPRLSWDTRWGDPGALELGIATGLLVTSALVDLFAVPDAPRWRAAPRLDDAARGTLVYEPGRRRRLRITGDLLAAAAGLQAQLVDPAFVVWAGDGNRAVARRLFAINGLAASVTALVGASLRSATARVRPYSDECLLESDYDPGCRGRDRYRSFFDGRVAMAFTAAALTCSHHRRLPLYGGRAAGRVACAGAATAAGLAGLFSVLTDRQHLTDLVAGLVVGLASGILIPAAYYTFGRSSDGPDP